MSTSASAASNAACREWSSGLVTGEGYFVTEITSGDQRRELGESSFVGPERVYVVKGDAGQVGHDEGRSALRPHRYQCVRHGNERTGECQDHELRLCRTRSVVTKVDGDGLGIRLQPAVLCGSFASSHAKDQFAENSPGFFINSASTFVAMPRPRHHRVRDSDPPLKVGRPPLTYSRAVQHTRAPLAQRQIPLWAVIVAGGLISAIALGVRSTFGLFQDSVIETIGTGRGTYGLMVAVQSLVWGFSQPIAGAVSDRFGAARTLATGGVLYALSLVLLSTSTSRGMALFSGGFLTGMSVGAASFAVVLSSVGRMVPDDKRSMTLGIVSALGSVGQFVLVPIAQQILDRTSWQTTVVTMAVIAASLVALTPILRGKAADYTEFDDVTQDADRPLSDDLRRAASSRSYWLLNGAFFVCGFHVTFIGTHLPSYVGDLGQASTVGSTALALIGLFNVVGSLSAGFLGQRHSYTKLLAGIYGLRAVFIAAYLVVPASAATTIIFAMAIGTMWLATVPLTSAIVTQQFGTAHSGSLFGIVFIAHQVGAFFGAWLGGTLADSTGSYLLMWWIAVALGVLAMVFHLLIDEGPVPQPPPSRVGGVRLAGGTAALMMAASTAMAITVARPGTIDAIVAYCAL